MSPVTKERKTQRPVARVSRNHKALLQRAAAIEGRSLATFVVSHAIAAAERLVERQEVIRLNAEQSRRKNWVSGSIPQSNCSRRCFAGSRG